MNAGIQQMTESLALVLLRNNSGSSSNNMQLMYWKSGEVRDISMCMQPLEKEECWYDQKVYAGFATRYKYLSNMGG